MYTDLKKELLDFLRWQSEVYGFTNYDKGNIKEIEAYLKTKQDEKI